MMSETGGYVKTVIQQKVGTIEFFHPQSNSLPGSMLTELAESITRAANDPLISVIVLQSAGDKTFCAGASFDELIAIDNIEKGKIFFSGFAQVINAMRKCPKFIVGRVQGKCVGGGVGLASSVDYCFATDKADIKLSELAVGIGPFVVGPAVERKIGTSAFSQLAIDAVSWRSAQWAKEHGLFAETYPTIGEMDESIDKLTVTLSRSNPEAMAEMKRIFWNGTENWDVLLEERAAISGRLVVSEFTRSAIAAFKKKA
jgi:methylglutaconyl-CoA hydratase